MPVISMAWLWHRIKLNDLNFFFLAISGCLSLDADFYSQNYEFLVINFVLTSTSYNSDSPPENSKVLAVFSCY